MSFTLNQIQQTTDLSEVTCVITLRQEIKPIVKPIIDDIQVKG